MANIIDNHMTMLENTLLKIEIKNNNPVELLEFTKSLTSLASQYERYVKKNDEYPADRGSKLLIKEVKSGSIILELFEFAAEGLIPYMEHTNTIVDFTVFLKTAFDYVLNKSSSNKVEEDLKSLKMDLADIKDMSSFVAPIADNNGSGIAISSVVNGNVTNNFYLDTTQSSAIQNNIAKITNTMSTKSDSLERTKVLLTFERTKKPQKAKEKGNSGVIEEISKKALGIFFENDNDKHMVLHGDNNPLKTAYVVDVVIQTKVGKPIAYKILKVHESFAIE